MRQFLINLQKIGGLIFLSLTIQFLIACTVNLDYSVDNQPSTSTYHVGSSSSIDPLTRVIQQGSDLVLTAALSPDDRYLITAGIDKTIKVWDIATGFQIRCLKGHSGQIESVAISPDGQLVLSGGWDNTVRLWELSSGRLLKTLKDNTQKWHIEKVSFSPDGRLALSFEKHQALRIWDLSSGRKINTIPFNMRVDSVDFSPDGKFALSGDWNNDVSLWDLETGKAIQQFKGHSEDVNFVHSVSFSPDGKFALSGSSDKTVRLWEVSTGKCLKILYGHDWTISSVAFSPDGQLGLSGGLDKKVILWDIYNGREIRSWTNHQDKINAVGFSHDGRFALSGSNDRTLRIWNVESGRLYRSIKGRAAPVHSVQFSPDGRLAIWGGTDGTIKLWEVDRLNGIRVFRGHSGSVNSIAISPDGKRILSGSQDKTIRLWSIKKGREILTCKGHTETVSSVAFSPDGKSALSGSKDKTMRQWNLENGRQLRVFNTQNHVSGVTYSPDGQHGLSMGIWFLRFWDLHRGIELPQFMVNNHSVNSSGSNVVFSKDGRFALSASRPNVVRLWDVSTSRELKSFVGHTDVINAVDFSPDGELALSGSRDKTLILWDTKTGKPIRTFTGHDNTVSSVAFSPNGKRALSGSLDGTVCLWDITSGQLIARMVASEDGDWICFTADGYYEYSPEGRSLVHFVEKDGLDVYSCEQFDVHFRRPDIVQSRLQGDFTRGKPAPNLHVPPRIIMESHRSHRTSQSADFEFSVTVHGIEPVEVVRVFVNGKSVNEIPVNSRKKTITISAPLFFGANRITIVAHDQVGLTSAPRYIDVTCTNPQLKQPNLHILAVGISQYHNLPLNWQLEFAHSDAIALVNSLSTQDSLYDKVYTKLLINENAGLSHIQKALADLEHIASNDVAVIYLAGHGIRDKDGEFYFLTADSDLAQPQKSGLNWSRFRKALDRVQGRVILLLDACHSGGITSDTVVLNDELANRLSSAGRTGIMIFSAAKSRQASMESPDFGSGSGVFTYALLQALGEEANRADLNQNGLIEFMELVDYVSQWVRIETQGMQIPWLARKEMFGDFPIATVK